MPQDNFHPSGVRDTNSLRSLLILLFASLSLVALFYFGVSRPAPSGDSYQTLEDAVYTVADTLLSIGDAPIREEGSAADAERERIEAIAKSYIEAHNAFHKGEGSLSAGQVK